MARTNDDDDDLFDTASSLADRLKLKGRDRSGFIDEVMQRGGYRRVQAREGYSRQTDDDDDRGSSFFRSSGRHRRSRHDDDDEF